MNKVHLWLVYKNISACGRKLKKVMSSHELKDFSCVACIKAAEGEVIATRKHLHDLQVMLKLKKGVSNARV